MAKVDVKCPFYGQTESVKMHGMGKAKHQRYRCQICSRTFQLDYAYRACLPGMKEQIVDLAMNNAVTLRLWGAPTGSSQFRVLPGNSY